MRRVSRLKSSGWPSRCALIFCQSTKITTSCWTTINRKTLEPTKKKDKLIQAQRRSCNRMVGGAQWQQNQILYLPSGWPTDWRTIIPKRFLHHCQDSSPSPPPGWGSGQGTANPQRIWLWESEGFDYRSFMGLGETETPLLEDTNKILCAPGPKEKETETDLPVSVWGSPQRHGWQWPTMGTGTLAVLRDVSWLKSSCRSPTSLP